MKSILIVLMMAYGLMAANAKDAAFALDFEENYKVALEKAKKEHKTLMLIVVQDPCPYCDNLVENSLEDIRVKNQLKNFIPLIIDKGDKFPYKFKGTPVPMTYFIDPNIEKSVYENLGYLDAPDFLKMLKNVEALRPRKIH